MTNVGRNDPCPCGSGKKYKKCCLKKDKAAARAEREAKPVASLPPSPPAEPPDPLTEARNAFLEQLQTKDYEGQIALFHKTLEEETELVDSEIAFEFLTDIYPKCLEHNERDRFETLADALRAYRPDVYTAEARYILDWRITNAIADGRFEDIPAMAVEMAQDAEKNIDEFFNLMNQLAYHNQLATLISATAVAWPQVKDSTRILGVDEFAARAVDYIVFNHITQTPTPTSDDPDLLAQIDPYLTLDLDRFSEYMTRLTGQHRPGWTMADFELDPLESDSLYVRDEDEAYDYEEYGDEEDEAYHEEKTIDEGRSNLYNLTSEFLGYLYRRENVPYAKGALGRTEIYNYILARYDGRLESPEPMFKFGRSKKRHAASRRSQHPLCPDRKTLDRFLVDLLYFINPQYYKATAALELVPAWLRFLESRRLIDAEQREQTLSELRGLDTEFLKVVKNYPDPALSLAIENWRRNAEQAAIRN